MKMRFILTIFVFLFLSIFATYAKHDLSEDMVNVIKLYKAGNYSECYTMLNDIIKEDPTNALAYYYKAMASVQIGRKDEAITNYEKVIVLTPSNSNLNHYASRGKNCIESPDMCYEALYDSLMDKFIRSNDGNKFSEEVQGEHERLKLEQLKRIINTEDNIKPQQFKDYKDFSSLNSNDINYTNDDIITAIRVLQKAGLYNDGMVPNDLNKNGYSALSNMTSMNPQLIQAIFSNNMTLGF